MLFYPLDSMADQLDSEIMPLRVQWAAEEGRSELDPHSESWQRFKKLYAFQFGEQKAVGLFAPELSFVGEDHHGKEQYNFGRYLRFVRLYVRPEFEGDFENFVHNFIVPTANRILAEKKSHKTLPPPEQRTYWQLPTYMRTVCINVNMPTIPEFELFVQQHLLRAARDTNTPLMTYRTVTGDKHNYHLLFPFNQKEEMHYDGKSLIATKLMREHQLQLLAKRQDSRTKYQPASYSANAATVAEKEAVGMADSLSAQFHSHAIDIEEIVQKVRPDMSAALPERFTNDSVQLVWSAYRKG